MTEVSHPADEAAITKFLSETVQDHIHLAAIAEGAAPICKWFGSNVAQATDWAIKQNAQSRGVYWTVNRATPHFDRSWISIHPSIGKGHSGRCGPQALHPHLS